MRELGNVIQRALILAHGEVIEAADILLDASSPALPTVTPATITSAKVALGRDDEPDRDLGKELATQEHQLILQALQTCAGSRQQVAEKLGISPRTLRYKLARMRDAGICVPV